MLSNAARRGRDLLGYLSFALVASEALLALAQVLRRDWAGLVSSAIRVTLLVLLLRQLLAGRTWARGVLVVLSGLATVLGSVLLGRLWNAVALVPLLIVGVYVLAALVSLGVLVLSDDVAAFFAAREAGPVNIAPGDT